MDNLEKMAKDLNIELINKSSDSDQKQRGWHFNEQESQLGLSTTLINTIDQSNQSNRFMNQIDQLHQNLELKDLRQTPLLVLNFLLKNIEDKEKKETAKLVASNMAKSLNKSINSIRSGIKFLSMHGFILKIGSAKGWAGWIKYRVLEKVFFDPNFNMVYQLHSISSSSINITTTELNTTVIENENWLKFDLCDLDQAINLKLASLNQKEIKSRLSFSEVQESIYHLAWAWKNSREDLVKRCPDVLKAFIGSLRKGNPWVEGKYVSEQKIALDALYEAKKRELEQIQARQKQILDLEFQIWINNLKSEEKKNILENNGYGSKKLGKMPEDVFLKNYFTENKWPSLKDQILGSST